MHSIIKCCCGLTKCIPVIYVTVSVPLLNQLLPWHRHLKVNIYLMIYMSTYVESFFNELIKPKNKQNKKFFGTSLRFYKHISGSITHLSNKQNSEECQEPIAKSSNQWRGWINHSLKDHPFRDSRAALRAPCPRIQTCALVWRADTHLKQINNHRGLGSLCLRWYIDC